MKYRRQKRYRISVRRATSPARANGKTSPVADSSGQSKPQPHARKALKSVLVVEDNATIGGLIAGLLGGEGFQAVRAMDVRSAVRLAREHPPDLILLDLGLPYRDGFGLLRELTMYEETSRAPVLIVTASTVPLDPEDRARVVDIVTKPFDMDKLVDTVRVCLGEEPRGPRFEDLRSLRERFGDFDHYPW